MNTFIPDTYYYSSTIYQLEQNCTIIPSYISTWDEAINSVAAPSGSPQQDVTFLPSVPSVSPQLAASQLFPL